MPKMFIFFLNCGKCQEQHAPPGYYSCSGFVYEGLYAEELLNTTAWVASMSAGGKTG